MSQAIVNLALPVVTEKIDEILEHYPVAPHRETFTSMDVRQKLVAYVLTRMPALYATVEDGGTCSLSHPELCYSIEQQRRMKQLIHQGIQHLVSQRQLHRETLGKMATGNAHLTPSSWFG